MLEVSALDMLDSQYCESENQDKLNYWAPLSKVILESIELRASLGLSQSGLAQKLNTTQSVISRFENMGRLPSYDFIARLATVLGHAPGITLYGDYMASVPLEKQEIVKAAAENAGVSTQSLIQDLLEKAVNELEPADAYMVNFVQVTNWNKSSTTGMVNRGEQTGDRGCQENDLPLAM